MIVKTSFNQTIVLDSLDEISMSAAESEFFNLSLTSKGVSVKVPIDAISGAKIVRGINLMFANQKDVKS